MEILTQLIGAPANALTLLIAAGILFIQMLDKGLIRIGKNQAEKVPEWGRKLTQYANHDTTERLDRLIEMEEKEHESAQVTRDTLVKMTLILEGMERNGLKCRKE